MCVCCTYYLNAGNYKVEIFDRQQNRYIPSVSGLGMHVDVKDPEDKTLLSRVSVVLVVIKLLMCDLCQMLASNNIITLSFVCS